MLFRFHALLTDTLYIVLYRVYPKCPRKNADKVAELPYYQKISHWAVFSGQETLEEETSMRETFKSLIKLCLFPHQLPTDQGTRSAGFALALYKISAEGRDFVKPVC